MPSEQSPTADSDYELLFDVAPDLLCVTDARGRFLRVNPAWEEVLGHRVEDLEGASYADLVHPDDVTVTRDVIASVAGGERVLGFVNRYRHRDGSYRSIEWRALSPEGDRIYAAARDITAAAESLDALRQQKELFELAERVAHAGSWRLDLRTGRVAWSDEMYAIFGLDKETFDDDVNEVVARAVHPEDRPMLEATNAAVLRDGVPRPMDYRILVQDGPEKWVHAEGIQELDEAGNVVALVGFVQDITERKSAEAARLLSEQKYSAAFRTSPDAVNINRLSDGWYLDVNKAFLDLMGYSAEEVLGKTSLELGIWADPEDRARLVTGLKEHGEVGNLEARFRRKDGGVTTALMSARVMEIDGETCILSVTRDISERKRAEEALRESEARLRLALAATRQGMYDLDLRTGFAKVTPEYLDMLGEDRTSETFDLSSFGERVHPDDRQQVAGLIDAYTRGDIDEYRAEFRLRRVSGDWIWVLSIGRVVERDENGMAVRVLGSHTDVTESKLLDARLAESEAEFRSIVESSPTGMHLYRLKPDGTLVLTGSNPMADEMLGVEHAGLIGKTIEEAFPGLADTEIPDMYRAVASGDLGAQAFEIPYADDRFSGLYAVTAFSAGPRMVVVDFADITARRAAEEELAHHKENLEELVGERTRELAAVNEQLRQATAAKSSFLANMSHELRTPLNSVIGFSRILQQGLSGALTEEQLKQVGMIHASGRHLLSLIDGVLDIAKIEAGRVEVRLEPFDAAMLVREVTDALVPMAAEKGLEIVTEVAEETVPLNSDAGKVRQILLNLVGNAIKFTERGRVALRLERATDGGAVFTVTDTGIGISQADLSRIFDAFTQIAIPEIAKSKGTGLGLTVSREFAHLLGGEVTARSEPGVGSTFTLTVPDRGVSHSRRVGDDPA
jgi:PAS domain S-box-containing protein